MAHIFAKLVRTEMLTLFVANIVNGYGERPASTFIGFKAHQLYRIPEPAIYLPAHPIDVADELCESSSATQFQAVLIWRVWR